MKTRTLVRLATLFMLAPLLQLQPQSAYKTTHGQIIKVNGARMQPCESDACATRGELSITLPSGAKYVATHYFTTADAPNDRADVYETGPKELALGRFTEAVHGINNHGQEVITVYYFNRASKSRWISINVDYE
jgi:hypothetical protein